MSKITRRGVLAGGAAAAVAAALPAVAMPAATAVTVPAPPRGWWGFTLNDEYWHGPYESREHALEAALEEADGYCDEVQTGLCIPTRLYIPDLRDDCAEWLAEGSEGKHNHWRSYGDLGQFLCRCIEGCNEDNDFEGEVSEAIAGADPRTLGEGALNALDSAFQRMGRLDLRALILLGEKRPALDDEVVFNALTADPILDGDLREVATRWAREFDLMDCPRKIDLEETEKHTVEGEPG